MKKHSARQGSALLIVIGMLAFLIVSAVGFSAYMRYARLPSSYLRRSASSRQLVKAAMAEAITTLDQAINDNPHPGVGSRIGPNGIKNIWRNRVLIGEDSFSESLENFDTTASPLCLEALAYIPPTLVNEARYYSRQTPTAEWRSFDYDIGRYTFCVLDVSDYFDVNRMFADKRRSSAAHQRISLSYLFEEGGVRHDKVGTGAADWDEFLEEEARDVDDKTGEITFDKKYPFISIADFNLALGHKGSIGNMQSPFYEYIMNGGSGTGFYGDVGKTSNGASQNDKDEALKRMTFVTDSLFPETTTAKTSSPNPSDRNQTSSKKVYDITDSRNQPFKLETLSQSEAPPNTLMKILTDAGGMIQGEGKKEWVEFIGQIGMVALYDYLDVDRNPLSLAIPTVERVPMICGVQPDIQNMKLALKKTFEPTQSETSTDGYPKEFITSEIENVSRRVRKTVHYKIDNQTVAPAFMGSAVRAFTVFPFSRKDENDGKFNVDGQLKLFFSSEPMKLRTGTGGNNENDVLHIDKDISETGHDVKTGITSLKLVSSAEISSRNIERPEEALQQHDFPLGGEATKITDVYNNNSLLTVEYEWDQTPQKDPNSGKVIGWTPSLEKIISENKIENIKKASTAFPAVKSTGETDGAFTTSESLKQLILPEQGSGKTVYFNCALWFRIKNEDDYVVDMVPACLQDDASQNKATLFPQISETVPGDSAYPLLRFETGVSFEFSVAGLEKLCSEAEAPSVTIAPKAAMVADPRYNHAPEDWFSLEEELTAQSWLAKNKAGDGDKRDGDIFMATSDAGYLQSIYELAFLPRTKTPSNGSPLSDVLKDDGGNNRATIAKNFDEINNPNAVWRTFDPFDVDKTAFAEMPFTNEGKGFKVNPYTSSTNVMMAVFANTPLGWRYASTNVTEKGVDFSSMKMEDYNKKYAFNAYNPEAELKWVDLTKIAGRFMDKMRSCNDGDWERVWREEMNWQDKSDTDGERFCGIDLDSEIRLWGVDKKYMYGFWKDCFAVKQQLFLVFVRAEPMMMGSGESGRMPPQLGGRAMALVWRDPTCRAEPDPKIPHKTRVLFYRQFD